MSYHNYANSKYVFLLGNGINNKSSKTINWESILKNISEEYGVEYVNDFPLPAFMELLTIYTLGNTDHKLKDTFIKEVEKISGSSDHREIYEFCNKNHIDILTTNFDHAIQKENNLEKTSTRSLKKGFTDFYPWQIFYKRAGSNIKLFHINGDIEYKRSIKLSVKDYAGNITKFNRTYRPSVAKSKYKTDKTWINVMFEKELVILGLGLGEDELFLRHLLIERQIYRIKNKLNKNDGINGYYLYRKKSLPRCSNKYARYELFFKSVGIEMKDYDDYPLMYKMQ